MNKIFKVLKLKECLFSVAAIAIFTRRADEIPQKVKLTRLEWQSDARYK